MGRATERLDQALGVAIRMRRQALGLSQAELAERVGVTFQQVQKYERALNRVSFSTLVRISRALDRPISHLMAEVEALTGRGVEAEIGDALIAPEAVSILIALSRIRSGALRRSLVKLAQDLASAAGP